MRTIIELTETQLEQLTTYCQKEGVSRAEAVRRAVDILLQQHNVSHSSDLKQKMFGVWKDNTSIDNCYQQQLREEWDDA